MPELPEVEMFRLYFDQTSLNQKITDVIIQHPKVARGFEEELTKLVGDQFASTQRWGKTMLIQTSTDKTIFMHFGMTGNLQYYNSSLEMPKYSRVVFEFDSGFNLGYVSKRMFGRLGLAESPDRYVHQKALGADALEIPKADFIKGISGKNKNIKAALLDQSVTAGVGNWIADEILYQAKILPESKCRDLTGEQLAMVHRAMQDIIRIAIDVDAVREALPDHFITRYGRKQSITCPGCGQIIERTEVSGRGTFACSNCQKLY